MYVFKWMSEEILGRYFVFWLCRWGYWESEKWYYVERDMVGVEFGSRYFGIWVGVFCVVLVGFFSFLLEVRFFFFCRVWWFFLLLWRSCFTLYFFGRFKEWEDIVCVLKINIYLVGLGGGVNMVVGIFFWVRVFKVILF